MSNPQQQLEQSDDLLDDELAPEEKLPFGSTNGDPPPPPVAVVTKPANRAANVAPGTMIQQEVVTKTQFPAGTTSPLTGERAGASAATQRGATPPAGSEAHAREFLERACSIPEQMKRTANWKIVVKRQAPFHHQGVPLDTTSELVNVALMPAPDLEAAVKGSHGGGRYRADVMSEAGVWQMAWHFSVPISTCPPITARNASNPTDGMHEVAKMEAQERIDRERRRFEREEREREEERQERKRQRETEERERANQNPAMQMFMSGMKEMMAAMQAQTTAIIAAITANKPADNGLKDMFPVLVEAMKSNKGENVEIAKANANAMIETAKLKSESDKAIAEAQAKINDAAQARTDKFMEMAIKANTSKESPQKALGEMLSFMKVIEDRFGGRDLPDDEPNAIQALLPEIVKVIGGFIQMRGSPSAAMASGALGLPPGATPNENQVQELSRMMAPYLLQEIRNRAQAQQGQGQLPPPSGAMTGPAPAGPAPQGGNIPPPVQPNPQPEQPQTGAPAPQQPAPPSVESTPDPVLQSSARERLIEEVTDTVRAMLADAVDRRAASTWVDDALNWNGHFLDTLVRAPDDAARLNAIRDYCDPVVWKSFEDKIREQTPDRTIIYNTWASGVKALVAEHAKRRGMR